MCCDLKGILGMMASKKKFCRKFVLFEDGCEVRNFSVNIKQFLIGEYIDVTALLKYLG